MEDTTSVCKLSQEKNVNNSVGEPRNFHDLTQYVQTLLQQMQDKFQTMSDQIVLRIDEMGNRIDELERSIGELMTQSGVDDCTEK